MVLGASFYAAIYSQAGDLIANHVDAEEREVKEADGVHALMTLLLSKEQSSKMIVGNSYQIRVGSGKTGVYKLVLSEDERLPLRRHTFRSETVIPNYRR